MTIDQNLPTTLKLFQNESLVYDKLTRTIPLPQGQSYFIKLAELEPQNSDSLIKLMEFANDSKNNEIFVQIEQSSVIVADNPSPYTQKVLIAKNYYLHALDLWNSGNQIESIRYFQRSVDYCDGWSYFYIELANAMWNTENKLGALNVLDQCQKIPPSKKHCQEFSKEYSLALPQPGTFKPAIKSLFD